MVKLGCKTGGGEGRGELRNRFVGYVLIGGGADVQTQHGWRL